MKKSGFNLEDTHVTHQDRLAKLLMLVVIAFVWCYKIGDYIYQKIKAIVIKTHEEEKNPYLDMDWTTSQSAYYHEKTKLTST